MDLPILAAGACGRTLLARLRPAPYGETLTRSEGTALSSQNTPAVPPRLSIIVPTHRRPASLRRLVESLATQSLDRRQFEVLIVANFTDPKLAQELQPWLANSGLDIQLLTTHQPGVNRARNMGLVHSRGSYALMLDDDCYLLEANYLCRLIELHESHATTFALGGPYLSPPGLGGAAIYYNGVCNAWLEVESNRPKKTTKLLGGAVSYKLAVLKEMDLYFQDSIEYGGAETELHDRVIGAGYEMTFHPDLAVVHAGQVSVPSLIYKAYRQGFGKVAHQLQSSRTVEVRGEEASSTTRRPSTQFYNFVYRLAFAQGERRARNERPRQSFAKVFFFALALAALYPVPLAWRQTKSYALSLYWNCYRHCCEFKGRLQSSVIRLYWTLYPVTYFFLHRGWRRPQDLLRIRMPLTHPNLETVGAPLWIAKLRDHTRNQVRLQQTPRLRNLGIETFEVEPDNLLALRTSELNTESAQIWATLAKQEFAFSVVIQLDQLPNVAALRRFFVKASGHPELQGFAIEAPTPAELPRGAEFEVFRWAHKLALAGDGLRLKWRAIYSFDEQEQTLSEHQPAQFSTRYKNSTHAPEVSVIIPHHRDFSHLRAVLRGLEQQDLGRDNFEVLVIDNGVAAALLRVSQYEALLAEFAGLRLALFSMRSVDEKLFLAGHARNVGLTHAQGRIIQFLDSDILLPAKFLSELVATMNHADVVLAKRSMLKPGQVPPPGALASLPKSAFYRENEYWESFKAARQWTDLQDFWKYACTYCLAVKRSQLLKSGPFEPSFTMYGFEDVDLAFRLFKVGAHFHFATSRVFHLYPSRDAHNYHVDEPRRADALRQSALNFFLKRPESAPFALCQGYFAPTLAEWLKRSLSPAITARRPHVRN